MIPLIAARILPYKWLAIGIALLAVAAWGGIGWYGKRAVELEYSDYRLAQARAVTVQLAENQRLRDVQDRRSAEIAAAYRKGKVDVAKSFQPALADLQMLRALFDGGASGRVPDRPLDDDRPVPGPADPPDGAHAVACTDRPAEIVGAAHRVAQDLEACAGYLAQLTALQRWIREIQARGGDKLDWLE